MSSVEAVMVRSCRLGAYLQTQSSSVPCCSQDTIAFGQFPHLLLQLEVKHTLVLAPAWPFLLLSYTLIFAVVLTLLAFQSDRVA